MSNIFADIIDRKIPADIVYEDELCLAFKDVNPQAPVHILLVPKKEIVSIATVEPEDKEVLGHLLVKAREIAEQAGVTEGGYRLVINTNADSGQSVFHLHIHILGGKRMGWPPWAN
ncbi:MAG: histidine triad nucleotide-binding protein [Candidatus Dadabacteria bacterium]|nr:histidine triad nucleotide-binding protein [Candidatus Dadabacteria bacterium]